MNITTTFPIQDSELFEADDCCLSKVDSGPEGAVPPGTASLRPLRMALMAFNLRLVRNKAPRFSQRLVS